MALYYFHLRDGHDILLDPDGRDVLDPGHLPAMVLRDARSVLSGDALEGRIMLDRRIDVQDERGAIVYTLHFADAIEMVFPKEPVVPPHE